ncbi:hypothetical protein AVEN_120836-1 [Araneus ventricosus]|uniref:Uncharacterized protein n=1 Tax=Araneus ventricosus TaxID=182803 RepID=A0A4Y2Q3N5_ARAVE|nr:hypothetical protein AVEN_120836-1 [Araneus ventricosus]
MYWEAQGRCARTLRLRCLGGKGKTGPLSKMGKKIEVKMVSTPHPQFLQENRTGWVPAGWSEGGNAFTLLNLIPFSLILTYPIETPLTHIDLPHSNPVHP